MVGSTIQHEIDQAIAGLDGELTSHSRAVDALLDVRGATTDRHLIALVDEVLRNLPGKNVTETHWLRSQLQHLAVMADVGQAAAANAALA